MSYHINQYIWEIGVGILTIRHNFSSFEKKVINTSHIFRPQHNNHIFSCENA